MNEPTALCYPIREPFKFRGAPVKPPAFVQMGRDEAKPYIDAGVIGGEDEACLPPDDAERLESARLEAERQAAADAEATRLEAERQAAADAEAARIELERQAAETAKRAGEDGKTAKDGDTKTTAASTPAAAGRGGRNGAR